MATYGPPPARVYDRVPPQPRRREEKPWFTALLIAGCIIASVLLVISWVAIAQSLSGGSVPNRPRIQTPSPQRPTPSPVPTTSALPVAVTTVDNDIPVTIDPALFVPTTEPPASLGTLGGETSTQSEGRVLLSLLCNAPASQRQGHCHAVFSYSSTHTAAVSIEVGVNNHVSPGPAMDYGQREVFSPGTHVGAATFMWDCTQRSFVRWTLRDGAHANVITVPAALTTCPALP